MLLKTKEKGECVIPFNEVKEKIRRNLYFEKQNKAKDSLIATLRSKVKIENKVDASKFVGELASSNQ